MKCARRKSSAVLLDIHTWHQPKIYTCLEMSLCPLVSIAASLGRHLKRRGQLKHSFSWAFRRRKGFKRSEICVIFPPVQYSGCVRAMCQGMTAEKKDGRRGRSGRQRPDFTQKAWDQWIGRLCTLHTLASKCTVLRFDGEIDLSGACHENSSKTYGQTHKETDGNAHKWNTSTSIPRRVHSGCSTTVPLPELVILTNGSG